MSSTVAKRDNNSLLANERARINFSWLIKLRWAAVIGQLATVLFVRFVLQVEVELIMLCCIIAIEALTNAAVHLLFGDLFYQAAWQKYQRWGHYLMVELMALDIFVLTALLYVSGGPYNPFGLFYLVNLALAAVVLPGQWAWALNGLAIVCYTLLFWQYWPLPVLEPWFNTIDPTHRVDGLLQVGPVIDSKRLHNQGMIVAFAAAASCVIWFITRVTRELAVREEQLATAERRRAQMEKLEALATLAAGAAHELATPLSTIAVVANELAFQLQRHADRQQVIEDAQLIRQEVARCRVILDQMAAKAGESVGESMVAIDPLSLLREATVGLRASERLQMQLDPAVSAKRLHIPKVAICQAIRTLIKNALDASEPQQPVIIRVASIPPRSTHEAEQLLIEVEDFGEGMPPEILQRIGEPFFTTKEPGVGTGLGVFLARSTIERLGGELRFRSEWTQGTTATVVLPLRTAPPQSSNGTVITSPLEVELNESGSANKN